jgi:hypothetical protein
MKVSKEGGTWKYWVIGVLVVVLIWIIFYENNVMLNPPVIQPIRPVVTDDYWQSLSPSEQQALLARQQAVMDAVRAKQDEILKQMLDNYNKKEIEYRALVRQWDAKCKHLEEEQKLLMEAISNANRDNLPFARADLDEFHQSNKWIACERERDEFDSIRDWLESVYPNSVIDFNNHANEVAAWAIGRVNPAGFHTPGDTYDDPTSPFYGMFPTQSCVDEGC